MCFDVQNSVVCEVLLCGITGCPSFTPFSVSSSIFTPQTLELSAVFNGQYLHFKYRSNRGKINTSACDRWFRLSNCEDRIKVLKLFFKLLLYSYYCR